MRHLDLACGQLFPIAGSPPMLIGYNATSPGVYIVFDPVDMSCREHAFTDSLQIDFACPSTFLDTDGITRLGEGLVA